MFQAEHLKKAAITSAEGDAIAAEMLAKAFQVKNLSFVSVLFCFVLFKNCWKLN